MNYRLPMARRMWESWGPGCPHCISHPEARPSGSRQFVRDGDSDPREWCSSPPWPAWWQTGLDPPPRPRRSMRSPTSGWPGGRDPWPLWARSSSSLYRPPQFHGPPGSPSWDPHRTSGCSAESSGGQPSDPSGRSWPPERGHADWDWHSENLKIYFPPLKSIH